VESDTERTPDTGEASESESAAEPLNKDADGLAADLAEIESRLCAGYKDLLASAKEIGDVTGHHVRRHPLAACGLAFLAGVALTRALRR
jgi:hypothetical protein